MEDKLLIMKITDKECVYSVKEDHNKKTLKYNVLGNWTKTALNKESCCSIEDTGNGYLFKDEFKEMEFFLDYSQIDNFVLLWKLMGNKSEWLRFENNGII